MSQYTWGLAGGDKSDIALSVDQSNQLPGERSLRPLDETKLDQAKELTQMRCDTETTAAELKRSSRTKSKRESNKTLIIQKVRVAGEKMSAADWVRQYGHTSLDCRALLLDTSARALRCQFCHPRWCSLREQQHTIGTVPCSWISIL